MKSREFVDRSARLVPPARVDRVIVHQVDVAHPVPGGVDGVIRGLLRFAPSTDVVVVVGVLAASGPGRAVGRWELHEIDSHTVWFLPVASLNSADSNRLVPHSVRLALGLARHRRRLPAAAEVHAHRADIAFSAHAVMRRTPLSYFVHNQENGVTSENTDSFWRRAPRLHSAMERFVISRARDVVVFNPTYAKHLAERSSHVSFSPNWYEPDVIRFHAVSSDPWRIVWLGRLEKPKDPLLAITAFDRLAASHPDEPWSLVVVGSGMLAEEVAAAVAALPARLRDRVELTGAVSPSRVGEILGGSAVFLMTSVPGYEGHPRALVEALASGLPVVVTRGSDTGSIVSDGRNGWTVGREPAEIATALAHARTLPREHARQSVEHLSAPAVVARVLRVASVDGS